jgi:hypothetical protein
MGDEYAGDIYVVAVSKGGLTEYWAAAVPREKAVEAVRLQVPPDRLLFLTERRLTLRQVIELKMRPGSVRKLKAAT